MKDNSMHEFYVQLDEESNGNVLIEALRKLTNASEEDVQEGNTSLAQYGWRWY